MSKKKVQIFLIFHSHSIHSIRCACSVQLGFITRAFLQLYDVTTGNLHWFFLLVFHRNPMYFLSDLQLYSAETFLINAVRSDVVLLEFINSIYAVSWKIGMANPSYLFGREISTISLSLHMWHSVAADRNLFLIVLSTGSSKWWMFGMVLRK